jgi:hypothetical protein
MINRITASWSVSSLRDGQELEVEQCCCGHGVSCTHAPNTLQLPLTQAPQSPTAKQPSSDCPFVTLVTDVTDV